MKKSITMPEELVYWMEQEELAPYQETNKLEDKFKDKLLAYYQEHDPSGINHKLIEIDRLTKNLLRKENSTEDERQAVVFPIYSSGWEIGCDLRMAYMLATRIMLVQQDHRVNLITDLKEAILSHIVNFIQNGIPLLPKIEEGDYRIIFWETYVLLYFCSKKSNRAERITHELYAYLTKDDDTLMKQQTNKCHGFDEIKEYVKEMKTDEKTYEYELKARPFNPAIAPRPNYSNQHSLLFVWLSQLNREQLEDVLRLYPTTERQEQLYDWITCEEASDFYKGPIADTYTKEELAENDILSPNLRQVLAEEGKEIQENIQTRQYITYETSEEGQSIFRKEVYEDKVIKALHRLLKKHEEKHKKIKTGHWAIVWKFFVTYRFFVPKLLQKRFREWVYRAFSREIPANTFKCDTTANQLKYIKLKSAYVRKKNGELKKAIYNINLDEISKIRREEYRLWIDSLLDTFIDIEQGKLVPNDACSVQFEIKLE